MFRFLVVTGCMAILIGCGGDSELGSWSESAKGDDEGNEVTLHPIEDDVLFEDVVVEAPKGVACVAAETLFHLDRTKIGKEGSSTATVTTDNRQYQGTTSIFTLLECEPDFATVKVDYFLGSHAPSPERTYFIRIGNASSPSWGGLQSEGGGACDRRRTQSKATKTSFTETTLLRSPLCDPWLRDNVGYDPAGYDAKTVNTYEWTNMDRTTLMASIYAGKISVEGDAWDFHADSAAPRPRITTYLIDFAPRPMH